MKRDHDIKRLTRIVKLLGIFAKGKLIISDIANETDVSVRTIQRDVRTIEESGFPIYSEKPGQVRFIEGFSLSRSSLSEEEASLLVVMSDITKNLGSNFINSFNSLKQKVLYSENTSPFFIKTPKGQEYIKTPLTKQLEESVLEHKVIKIKYLEKDGAEEWHTIHPYKIVYYDGFWYLYSLVSGYKRTFKLELIKDCQITNKNFKPRANVLKKLDESTNIWFGIKPKTKVRLLIDADIAQYFKEKQYFPYQKTIKIQKNGDIEIETIINHEQEIIQTILGWMPNIKILAPNSIRALVKKIISNYKF